MVRRRRKMKIILTFLLFHQYYCHRYISDVMRSGMGSHTSPPASQQIGAVRGWRRGGRNSSYVVLCVKMFIPQMCLSFVVHYIHPHIDPFRQPHLHGHDSEWKDVFVPRAGVRGVVWYSLNFISFHFVSTNVLLKLIFITVSCISGERKFHLLNGWREMLNNTRLLKNENGKLKLFASENELNQFDQSFQVDLIKWLDESSHGHSARLPVYPKNITDCLINHSTITDWNTRITARASELG